MRLAVILLLLASIALSGCSNVRAYTFKKDRVDQRPEGNKGYIMGTPPPAPIEEPKKRTMFGLDIEIPILPGEKVPVSSEEVVVVEEDVYYEEPYSEEKTNFEPRHETPEVIEEDVVIEEEDWIK
jgi:hypothetical protein